MPLRVKRVYLLRADEVTRLCQAKGWDLKRLARETELDISSLRRNLAGRPSLSGNVQKLAEVFDVSVESLVVSEIDVRPQVVDTVRAPDLAATPVQPF